MFFHVTPTRREKEGRGEVLVLVLALARDVRSTEIDVMMIDV
jgi:hypothetical protein